MRRLVCWNVARRVLIGCCLGGAWLVLPAAGMAQEKNSIVPPATDPELDAVAKLLDIAWSGNPQAEDAFKAHYESQRKQVQQRARWHFAYGIGSLKLKRHAAAVQAFQAAVRDAETFQFAPWKGLIWTELTLKHHDAALAQVDALAKAIADPDFSGTDAERERIAVWIGQTLAAVEKLNTAPKIRQRLSKTEDALAEAWNKDLWDAYQSGRDYTAALYDDLMQDVSKETATAQAKEKQQLADKQERLKDGVKSADEKRAALKKANDDLKKQAEQQLVQVDKQLARLDRDYAYLESRAMSVMQSLAIAQRQMSLIQQRQSQGNQQTAAVTNANNQAMQQLDFMLGLYQQELNATMVRGSLVAQRAMETLQYRNQLVGQAQSTSAELSGQQEALSKWQQRMTKAAEKVGETKVKGNSLSVKTKRAKAKNLNTYLDFDPDWERIQLTERSDPS